MAILKLKQTNAHGHSKTWKLDSRKKIVTLGTSRKAHLSSIDSHHSPFHAVIEYKNGKWFFIQFEASCDQPNIEITNNYEYKFAHSTIQFEVVEKPLYVAQSLHQIQTEGSIEKQLIIVSKNNRILKTQVNNPNEKFKYVINGKPHTFTFNASLGNWDIQEFDGLEFKCKLISVENLKYFSSLPSDQLMDKESKKMVYATVLAMFLFVGIGLFGEKKNILDTPPVPQVAQNIIIKTEKKQKTQAAKSKNNSPINKVAVQNNQLQPNNKAAAASNNKVNALVKGALGARISQLMGKVSATDARTANVIATTQGIKAGQGESGRALAAIGNVDSSGRNWTGEAVGSASGKVSTAGIAGGKGTGGLSAGLSAGKTGSGGVGLLEDESEVEGGLDRETIAQYIKTQLGQILYCYERQLSATPDIHGKVAVKFTISGTGQVVAQNIGDTTLRNQPVEGCILSKISKWKFPEPKGGTKVVVTYPFLFKSVN